MSLRLTNVGYGSWCGGPVDSSPSLHALRLSALSMGHLERWIWVSLESYPIVKLSQVGFGLMYEDEDAVEFC